jgi:hypothetical protein
MLEIISLSFVTVISMLLAKKHKEIAWAIAIAFVFRISATLINLYVVNLPDGADGGDAFAFEYQAWIWGNQGLTEAISHFFSKGLPWSYSNFGSLVYVIVGRSPLILSFISLLAGVYCVVLAWKVSMQVWDSHTAAKTSAWLVAIYPILILYSSLTMREVFITMLLLYGLLYVTLWVKTKKLLYAFIAFIVFSTQLFLHPGVATAGILFLGILLLYYIKTLFSNLSSKASIDMKSLLIVLCVLLVGFYVYKFSSSLSFPYFTWLNIENLIVRVSYMNAGPAAYPSWIMAENITEYISLLVPKLFYFLFSPFPWDISKFKHIIGFLDGVVYLILFISIFSYRKYIKSNPRALILLLFLIFLSLIFTVAVGNFGTGLRHRSKLVPIIIILASPMIYQLFFFMKKKLKLE